MSTLAKRTFTGKKIGSGARNILTVLLALVYLIPLYIAVVNSVKPYQDVIKAPLSPTLQPTMENFTEAFHSSKILSLYGTSILITGSSLLLLIFISSTAAYIIIRRKNRICKFLYGFALIGIMVPPVVTLVPSIKTLSMLGLMYSPWGLLMFYGGTYFSTTIFLYTGFINSIPVTLDESAYNSDGHVDLERFPESDVHSRIHGGQNDYARYLQFHRRIHFQMEPGFCQRYPCFIPDRCAIPLHAETVYGRPDCRRGEGIKA